MKPTFALLIASALLLSSCSGPQTQPAPEKPAAVDPATIQPAAPVVGRSVELQQIPARVRGAAVQLSALTDPNNPDLDPDLKALLALFQSNVALPTVSGVVSFGRGFAQGLGRQGRVTMQGLDAVQVPLPTGTVTVAADGTQTRSATPVDGYVLIDTKSNTRLEAKWRVGGAATVFIDSGSQYNPQTGQLQKLQQEVPTNAAGSATLDGKTVAQLTFAMTPGNCINSAGPTALTLSGWGGRAANPPAKVDVKYAWTDQSVSLSASALYRTTRQQASAALKLEIAGTTQDRCGDNFAFTPTRADLTATLDIPGYKTDFAVYLRDLSNLTISAESMRAQNPFQKIGGSVNASLNLNGQPVMTAFGPLADGNDVNLQPGDQVKVQYVRNGQLVMTDLDGALRDLQAIFAVRY